MSSILNDDFDLMPELIVKQIEKYLAKLAEYGVKSIDIDMIKEKLFVKLIYEKR